MKKFMMTTCAAIIALLLAPASGYAKDTAESRFDQGNRAYVEERFDEAAERYESILEMEGVSAAVLYNLANTYREQGKKGQAILNYERALWLAPRDPDLRAAVETFRKDEALFTEPDPVWIHPLKKLSLGQWTWMASGAWTLLGLLALVRGLGVERRPGRAGLAAALAVLLIAGCGVVFQLGQTARAVVLQDEAPLRVSPYEAAKSVTTIREGKIVRAVNTHGDFVKIVTATGQEGWMAAEQAELIIPVSPNS